MKWRIQDLLQIHNVTGLPMLLSLTLWTIWILINLKSKTTKTTSISNREDYKTPPLQLQLKRQQERNMQHKTRMETKHLFSKPTCNLWSPRTKWKLQRYCR